MRKKNRKNKTLVMMASIFIIAMFIGTSISTVIASPAAFSAESENESKEFVISNAEEESAESSSSSAEEKSTSESEASADEAGVDKEAEDVSSSQHSDAATVSEESKEKSDCTLCGLSDDAEINANSLDSITEKNKEIIAKALVILAKNPSFMSDLANTALNDKSTFIKWLAKYSKEDEQTINALYNNIASIFLVQSYMPEKAALRVTVEGVPLYHLFDSGEYIGNTANMMQASEDFKLSSSGNDIMAVDGLYVLKAGGAIPYQSGTNVAPGEDPCGAGGCLKEALSDVDTFLEEHPEVVNMMKAAGNIAGTLADIAGYVFENSGIGVKTGMVLKTLQLIKRGVEVTGAVGTAIAAWAITHPIKAGLIFDATMWAIKKYCEEKGCPLFNNVNVNAFSFSATSIQTSATQTQVSSNVISGSAQVSQGASTTKQTANTGFSL